MKHLPRLSGPWLLIVSILLAPPTSASAQTARTLQRQFQHVVMDANLLQAQLGAPVDDLLLYAYRSTSQTWELIPFQIDERILLPDPYDPGREWYDYFSPDDGLLDVDDELVFMCRDLGDRAPGTAWLADEMSRTHPRLEIHVTDDATGGAAWGYLYRTSTVTDTVPKPYGLVFDAERDMVISNNYRVRMGRSTGLIEDIAIMPPHGNGLDIFDTQKIRMVGLVTIFSLSLPFGRDWNPLAANERDNLFIYGDSTLFMEQPVVRLVRQGLESLKFGDYVLSDARFPVQTKFYPYSGVMAGGADLAEIGDMADIEVDLLRQSWDFNVNARGMRLYNKRNRGVLIDGQRDTVDRTVDLPIREWFMATGDQGTLITTFAFTDTLEQGQELYYHDDLTGGQADGTQVEHGDTGFDFVSYGDIGVLARGRGEKPNLRLDFKAYFLPGNMTEEDGREVVRWIEQPLEKRAATQEFTGTAVQAGPETGPARLSLRAQPNPFLGGAETPASITLQLARGGETRISIVDLRGRVVRMIHSSHLPPGEHRWVWDGRNDSGRILPAGVYFVRLEAEAGIQLLKLTLLR